MTHLVYYEVKETGHTEELRIVDAKNQKEAKLFAKKFCASKGYTPKNLRFTTKNKRNGYVPEYIMRVDFKPYDGFEEDIKNRGRQQAKAKGVLDEQAKDDLLLLYNDIDSNNTEKREFFWSVLECAGCEEEFREHLEQQQYESDD